MKNFFRMFLHKTVLENIKKSIKIKQLTPNPLHFHSIFKRQKSNKLFPTGNALYKNLIFIFEVSKQTLPISLIKDNSIKKPYKKNQQMYAPASFRGIDKY